ncbi:hypothetical protein [Paenibacillus sp. NPDC055715]
MLAKKGQKFKGYTFEIQVEAIRLHIEKVGHIVNSWRSSGLQIDIG